MFDSYQLEEATGKEHDFWIAPKSFSGDEPAEEQMFRAWEVVDEEFCLAVEDSTPEEAISDIESQGWDTEYTSNLERDTVKKVETDVSERVAYYFEDAPENRYIEINRRPTKRFLEQRGVWERISRLEDSWYYPEKQEFVAIFSEVDQSGEAARVAWRSDELSEAEKRILLGEDEPEEDAASRERVAEIVEENSRLQNRAASIAACWWDDVEDRKQIVDWIEKDITQSAIKHSESHYINRIQRIAWEVEHVWPYIPEEKRPEEVEQILKSIEGRDPSDPEYRVD